MHPILSERGRLAFYLAVWLPVGAVLAALLGLSGRMPWAEAWALALPLAIVFGFVCLNAWYLCRALPLRSSPYARFFVTHAAAAAMASVFWLLAGRGWAELLQAAHPPFLGIVDRFLDQAPLLLAVGALLFLLAVAGQYLLIMFEASRAAEKRALEVRVLSREAELKVLRSQLQPHFLFNSLNSISALTRSDPEGARRMCLLLAEFLRNSLRLGAREAIPLSEELALAEGFLAVEKVRFGSRLAVERRIEEGCGDCLVPPLLLQPLVENAVSHGIAGVVEGGTVRIEARRRAERLDLLVENPRDPTVSGRSGTGVGLDNVRRRLEALYGTDARLDIGNEGPTFRVELDLPAVTPAEAHVAG
jgi:hypothetical protein